MSSRHIDFRFSLIHCTIYNDYPFYKVWFYNEAYLDQMSGKGGRKNLGTVVECSETGDDCTSPLLISKTDSGGVDAENKEPVSEEVTTEVPPISETDNSKTTVVDSLILDDHINQVCLICNSVA